MKSRMTRRGVLSTVLGGAALMGIRTMVTGVPVSAWLRPLEAHAAESVSRLLILLNSRAGDPLGCNVPGTYADSTSDPKNAIVHPLGPEMDPTPISLGGSTHLAAMPWSTLPQAVLDQTCFIHHATRTQGHSNHEKVLKLLGAVERDEMSVSVYAKALAEQLGTIQAAPISLSDTRIAFDGRELASVSPRGLKAVLAPVLGEIGDLRDLRDQELDRIYGIYKEHGTAEQAEMLDRWAQSREQARQVDEDLIALIEDIEDDGDQGQALAAPVLAAMNVSPVIAVRLRFGGDNHNDEGLARETEETVTGMAALNTLLSEIERHRNSGALKHDVVVASLNVFGRTLESLGTTGRDHNALHHGMVLMGPGVRPGVVGSVSKQTKDWGADAIDSVTGAGGPGGDIPVEESLGAVGKTLGALLGVPREVLDAEITEGKVIEAALA